ncbi:MAG: clostripain-related cysteine peptidase [Promethearchaeota archaeon]
MKRICLTLTQSVLFSFLFINLLGIIVYGPFVQNFSNSSRQTITTLPKWTFMVYLDADNNLDSYGVEDLNEMEDGFDNFVASDVNVIVYIDRRYSGATTYKVVEDHNMGSLVSTIQTTGLPSEPNMGAKATLKAFIEYIFNNHPAENYALILWDHGSGIFGICFDESSSDDGLSFDEVDEAITEACTDAGEKIDILAMDACLMQMLEINYELREYIDIIVASEETIPGDGFPYENMIATLCDDPNQNPYIYADAMVDDYHDSYSYDTTISAVNINSTSINNLMDAFNQFTANLSDMIISYQSTIVSARAVTQEFYITSFIDLQDFAEELKTKIAVQEYKDACQEMIDAIKSAVIDSKQNNNPGANGIAIYFPESSSSYWSGYSSSIDLGQETGWDEFLSLYYYGPSYGLALNNYDYYDYISLDPSNNNNNNIVEQGETINVSITIRNTGTEDATFVNGTLSCLNGNISILIAFQDYSSIAAGFSEAREFQFNVSESAANGQVITLDLLIQATVASATDYQRYESLILVINQSSITGGDGFDTAVLITEGIFDSLMPGPDPLYQSAWFKITVDAEEFLIVSILTAADGSDFDIYIYDPLGTFITAAIKSTYPDTCSTYAHITGDYRIEIYPYQGQGTYTLDVSIANTTGPEDGFSIGTAISLTPDNQSYTNNLPAATPDGEMYFRVFLQEGQSITVLLQGNSSQNDFDLSLYSYELEELDWSWSYSYPERIEWTAAYTGYYYFIVWVWDGNGEFEIEVDFGGTSNNPIPFGGWWIIIGLWVIIGLGFLGRRCKF